MTTKQDQLFLRTRLEKLLENNVVEVKFIKNDGEVRKMICTLSHHYLPEEYHTNGHTSEDVLTVWDMEKNDWRSFRIDSVLFYVAIRTEDEVTKLPRN